MVMVIGNYLWETDKAAACGLTADLFLIEVVITALMWQNTALRLWSRTVQSVQQTAVKEVTRSLPSLAEWGVAVRD